MVHSAALVFDPVFHFVVLLNVEVVHFAALVFDQVVHFAVVLITFSSAHDVVVGKVFTSSVAHDDIVAMFILSLARSSPRQLLTMTSLLCSSQSPINQVVQFAVWLNA